MFNLYGVGPWQLIENRRFEHNIYSIDRGLKITLYTVKPSNEFNSSWIVVHNNLPSQGVLLGQLSGKIILAQGLINE